MKQRAHAWCALRALKLIEDSGEAPELVEMLCFYLSDVWNGAWLPDSLIVDMAYGHIFKMDMNSEMLGKDISSEAWLKVPYDTLKSKLKGERLCLDFVKNEPILNVPYASLEGKGGHLPERVAAISHSISDMLKMSDYPLAFYSKKKTPKAYQDDLSAQSIKDLSISPNFSARQVAQMFFILSHYITDAHMPLHCDLRDFGGEGEQLRRLSPKLHPSIEDEWEKHFPPKEVLALHQESKVSLDEAVKALPMNSIIRIDKERAYSLENGVAVSGPDEWTEMILTCRISFALAYSWIHLPYENVTHLIQARGIEDFMHVTNSIFHDTVCSISAFWLKAWKKFTT